MYNVSIKNNIESADIARTSHRKPRASPAGFFIPSKRSRRSRTPGAETTASHTSRLIDAYSLLNRLDG